MQNTSSNKIEFARPQREQPDVSYLHDMSVAELKDEYARVAETYGDEHLLSQIILELRNHKGDQAVEALYSILERGGEDATYMAVSALLNGHHVSPEKIRTKLDEMDSANKDYNTDYIRRCLDVQLGAEDISLV